MRCDEETEASGTVLAHMGENGGQTLRAHLCGVARLARAHAAKLGLGEAGALLGLLHDLGKSTGAFQDYLRSDPEPQDELRGKLDHSTAGAQCVVRNLPGGEEEAGVAGLLARLLALCIASHHSGLIDCLKPEGGDGLEMRLAKGEKATRYGEAWRTLDPDVRAEAQGILRGPELRAEFKAKIAAVCKRTSGGPERNVQLGLLARLLFSCLIDADRTDTADFERPGAGRHRQGGRYAGWAELERRLDAGLLALRSEGAPEVNAVRRSISDQCFAAAGRPGGVYTLTVPTGGGKTLAALRFALAHARERCLDRVIFVSPYISIVDQNAAVARGMLEPATEPYASVVLEHHSNLAPEDPGHEQWRRKLLAENWDAPVVFTTMAQVLEAMFGRGTRGARRMHAMAKAVLVFDEVQTLPVKLVHLFNNAVNLLAGDCGSTVLLCTATQPLLNCVDEAKGKLKLAPGAELVRDTAGVFRALQRYRVLDRTDRVWECGEAAELACAEARAHGSCLLVVNTKANAREIFAFCREQLRGVAHVAHLSTGMCPAHRTAVLADLKARLKEGGEGPVVCVSTQLIEAGVDIDFAAVIRELAGLDSLAQAAGRCNRNGRRAEGRVHIVKLPPLPKGLAEIAQGQQVAEELLGLWRRKHPGEPFPLDDPEQMRGFYEKAFYRRAGEMSWSLEAKDKVKRETTMLELLGDNGQARSETARIAQAPARSFWLQSFETANDAFALIGETEGVVVPWGPHGSAVVGTLCAARDPEGEWQLLRAAQPYTIAVYPSLFKRLRESGAVYAAGAGVWCLQPGYYDEAFGLCLEGGPLEGMFG